MFVTVSCLSFFIFFFFFNDTATTEIYTLSLHDALPISRGEQGALRPEARLAPERAAFRKIDLLQRARRQPARDRVLRPAGRRRGARHRRAALAARAGRERLPGPRLRAPGAHPRHARVPRQGRERRL